MSQSEIQNFILYINSDNNLNSSQKAAIINYVNSPYLTSSEINEFIEQTYNSLNKGQTVDLSIPYAYG